MVPANASYFFYIYPDECDITLWVDGVQTNIFPSTAVPYAVDILVTYNNSLFPIHHADVYVVEENGRNLLSPMLSPGRQFSGRALMRTDSNGYVTYALSPTRYNVPDSYGYSSYVEVTSPAYCRADFVIASYSYLTPTYRTSLVNASYESQVKSSVQNMNQLATTASNWIYASKYRNVTFNVTTTGAIEGTIPTLKAGAPNIFNITLKAAGVPVVGNITVQETDGLIIFVPLQPDKLIYNDSGTFLSNQSVILIPTRYNNDANLTFLIDYGGSPVTTIAFNVDSLLEPPTPTEADMDPVTNALIASALQNINQVLSNIGKSISTV